MTIISVFTTTDGKQSNDFGFTPSISACETKIGIQSQADNLVTCDTNGRSDIFVKDLTMGAITYYTATRTQSGFREGEPFRGSGQSPEFDGAPPRTPPKG